jgi:excisionase family DNA binding protein
MAKPKSSKKAGRRGQPRPRAPWADEVVTIQEAAAYLKCSSRTLEKWIRIGRFGPADGLRRVGDLVRFHMPTLRRRVEEDTLMSRSGPTAKPVNIKREKTIRDRPEAFPVFESLQQLA